MHPWVGLDHDVMTEDRPFCVSPPAGSGTGHANRGVVVVGGSNISRCNLRVWYRIKSIHPFTTIVTLV